MESGKWKVESGKGEWKTEKKKNHRMDAVLKQRENFCETKILVRIQKSTDGFLVRTILGSTRFCLRSMTTGLHC